MQKLLKGIQQFQQSTFAAQKGLFEKLSKGQQPLALFITCSDSRIVPNLLTQTEPGELFIIRNAGNIVPAHGALSGGEAATIEYAIEVLKIRDIVICGHSQCGAMSGLLAQEQLAELPTVKSWLIQAEATTRIIKANYSHISDRDELLKIAVETNVLVQLENLRTHPSVAAALQRGEIRLHAWVYTFQTGQVSAYDSESGHYVPLEETSLDPDDIAVNTPIS